MNPTALNNRYAGAGRAVVSAVGARGMFSEAVAVLAVQPRTLVWADKAAKLETCRRTELSRDILRQHSLSYYVLLECKNSVTHLIQSFSTNW